MFTGIISHLGKLERLERAGSGGRLVLSCRELEGRIKKGGSLSVDGVCLTMTEGTGSEYSFDVSRETIEKTTLGTMSSGRALNLEFPVAAGEPLGGHVVTGHVDGASRVLSLVKDGAGAVLSINVIDAVGECMIQKGSIAVNGVSLTIAALEKEVFRIAIIPETLRTTNLGKLSSGSLVNLEGDILVKSALRAGRGEGLTIDKLREAGF